MPCTRTKFKTSKEELHAYKEEDEAAKVQELHEVVLEATRVRSAAKRSLAEVLEEKANTRFERVSRHERMVAASEIAASSLSKRRLFEKTLS